MCLARMYKTERLAMRIFLRSLISRRRHFTWADARDYFVIALGALLQALAIHLFLVPGGLVNGGISGLAQIIYHKTGWPIGLMIFLGNVPLFVLGWRFLGGPRFALRTAFAVIAVSVFTDILGLLLPYLPISYLPKEPVLFALYGGVISGVGYGLVYRSQGTSGGSDILARILNNWRGITISQSYLLTDSLIMFGGGLIYGIDNALFAIAMLYISGVAAEAVMDGSNVIRTALIITSAPKQVADLILSEMERGVTLIPATGAYTGAERTVLYCVITRSEEIQLKALVREADPKAFMVIGQAHEALGEGFKSWKPS
jgi:uncharacterized membrane-anchored protein YitT (DUF2179 family)